MIEVPTEGESANERQELSEAGLSLVRKIEELKAEIEKVNREIEEYEPGKLEADLQRHSKRLVSLHKQLLEEKQKGSSADVIESQIRGREEAIATLLKKHDPAQYADTYVAALQTRDSLEEGLQNAEQHLQELKKRRDAILNKGKEK